MEMHILHRVEVSPLFIVLAIGLYSQNEVIAQESPTTMQEAFDTLKDAASEASEAAERANSTASSVREMLNGGSSDDNVSISDGSPSDMPESGSQNGSSSGINAESFGGEISESDLWQGSALPEYCEEYPSDDMCTDFYGPVGGIESSSE